MFETTLSVRTLAIFVDGEVVNKVELDKYDDAKFHLAFCGVSKLHSIESFCVITATDIIVRNVVSDMTYRLQFDVNGEVVHFQFKQRDNVFCPK